MRFHFVGGLDCPDWIFAEIASFSKLPVLKFRNWCSKCVEHLINGRNNLDDVQLTVFNPDNTLDEESLKAMLAALLFILEKSTKNACSAHDLELEMQQLGLPTEHCKQLTKVYAMNIEKLKSALLSNFIREPFLSVSSVDTKEGEAGKMYMINMRTSNEGNISIALNDTKLNYLVQELSQAMEIIRPYIQNSACDA